MGYEALLFCPDEKLARVVSQVFSELDFVVDPVNEPFAAVKKLMAQRYDAVVIDCDNEQNSSLLLRSAHTSTLNQGSLAIAMVEGQAGVARAYRIGANLVLTKPINLEQTKGTLRVARGLLRKNSETANAAAHPSSAVPAATPAPTPVARPTDPANRIHEVVAAAPLHGQSPEFEGPRPAMAATARPQEKSTLAPASVTQKAIAPRPTAPAPPAPHELVKTQVTPKEVPAQPPVPVLTTPSISQSVASAPAPAKETVAAPKKVPVKKEQGEPPEIESAAPAPTNFSTGAAITLEGPSFAALGDDNAGGSGSRRILIAAIALLAVAVTGYFGWTQFGQVHSTPASQASTSVPQTQPAPAPQSDLTPTSTPSPVTAPSAGTTRKTSAMITAPKASSAPPIQTSTASSSSRESALLQPEAKKAASTPLLVKSATANKQEQTDAPSVQLPSPLAVASPTDSGLGGLLSSASSSVSKPSLATIKISQGVSQGMVIKRVQPRYPANALASHIQGAVQIDATVDKEGKVVNPKVLSGDPILAAAALEAVRQWRYKPYYLDGEPVEIQTQITIKFKTN
jgi:protein TonB